MQKSRMQAIQVELVVPKISWYVAVFRIENQKISGLPDQDP
jgi:hypothetical protein